MSRSAHKGFTLTELLVVLAIIAVLVALLLPSVRRVREASPRMKCRNNLKQLMLAIHIYESAHGSESLPSTGNSLTSDSLLPPGCIGSGTTPEERLSWMVALLPYLEQEDLYRRLDLKKGYAGNLPAIQTDINTFLCPGSKAAKNALTNYVAMSGIGRDAASQPAGAPGNGFMGYDRRSSLAAINEKDGSSNTIALMETRFNLGPWARGGPSTLRGFDAADLPLFGDQRPFGGHEGGFNVAMVDGSVRFLRATIDPQKLAAAITIDGGERVDLD